MVFLRTWCKILIVNLSFYKTCDGEIKVCQNHLKKRKKPDFLQNTQKVRFTLRQARAGRPVMTVKEFFIPLNVFESEKQNREQRRKRCEERERKD